jgi:hypothetical protein
MVVRASPLASSTSRSTWALKGVPEARECRSRWHLRLAADKNVCFTQVADISVGGPDPPGHGARSSHAGGCRPVLERRSRSGRFDPDVSVEVRDGPPPPTLAGGLHPFTTAGPARDPCDRIRRGVTAADIDVGIPPSADIDVGGFQSPAGRGFDQGVRSRFRRRARPPRPPFVRPLPPRASDVRKRRPMTRPALQLAPATRPGDGDPGVRPPSPRGAGNPEPNPHPSQSERPERGRLRGARDRATTRRQISRPMSDRRHFCRRRPFGSNPHRLDASTSCVLPSAFFQGMGPVGIRTGSSRKIARVPIELPMPQGRLVERTQAGTAPRRQPLCVFGSGVHRRRGNR